MSNEVVRYDPAAAARRREIVAATTAAVANVPPAVREEVARAIIQGISSGELARTVRSIWSIVPTQADAYRVIERIRNFQETTGMTWDQMRTLLPQNSDQLRVALAAAVAGGTAGAGLGGPVGAVAGAAGAFLNAGRFEETAARAVGHDLSQGPQPRNPRLPPSTSSEVAIGADGSPTTNGMIDEANDVAEGLWGGRTRGSAPGQQHVSSQNTNMDASGPQRVQEGPTVEAAAALRAGGGGTAGNSNVSKETPISPYPTLNYGLQETHTTILPYKTWFSVYKPDAGTPIQAGIRMNSIVDMMSGLSMNNAGAALAKGFYNRPFKHDGTITHTGADGTAGTAEFPAYIPNATDSLSEKPAWREFWFKQYEYYTVLKTHYTITIYNAVATQGASIMVGVQFDSFSDTAGASGNKMPTSATLKEAIQFKNIKWEVVEYARSEHPNKHVTVIEGTYVPGMIRRNIQNDGDVKTWTQTTNTGTPSSSIPNLKDLLTLNFWRAPMAWETTCACNVEVDVKYIVQFKDLKEQWRYPYSGSTATSLTTSTDILMGQ